MNFPFECVWSAVIALFLVGLLQHGYHGESVGIEQSLAISCNRGAEEIEVANKIIKNEETAANA